MARNFQDIINFANSKEEIVLSKQEALAIAEREMQLQQIIDEYHELRRAMSKIMAAINEYKKEADE